ncbi:4-hydroxy-2-oxoheptanedioate aldolase [Acinetobacter baumannii]|nr:4-hydroxy-2-oxoheptanedioate aldolase [Acinetobacter baumannii]
MVDTTNYFKRKLKAKEQQLGLWVGLADADGYCAEIAANAGYDWLLIDGEHAPNSVRTILTQLQSVAAYPSQPIVRPVIGDVSLIKQLLDIGAQTLLIPMIETAEQAELMVKATRYPPDGIRGVGAVLARASRWDNVPNYIHTADQEICLLLQIESRKGLENLDAILQVEGVDGIFIGPADLSAELGHRGNPGHEEVQNIIVDMVKKIHASGKAAGIFTANEQLIRKYMSLDVEFIGIGVDTCLLMDSMKQLLAKIKEPQAVVVTSSTGGYK